MHHDYLRLELLQKIIIMRTQYRDEKTVTQFFVLCTDTVCRQYCSRFERQALQAGTWAVVEFSSLEIKHTAEWN
jgi:hypothetical protein